MGDTAMCRSQERGIRLKDPKSLNASAETVGMADVTNGPVDILIATPGRLMAHLKGTPGATLQHLRYLVRPDSLLR